MGSCRNCKFWDGDRDGLHWFDGTCIGLRRDDKVEIEVTAGWEGGYVSGITTNVNFGCKNFVKYEAISEP